MERNSTLLAIFLAVVVTASVVALPGAALGASQATDWTGQDGLNESANESDGPNVVEAQENETGENETNQTDQNQTGLNETDENQTGLDETDQNETEDNETSIRQPGITEDGQLNLTELYAAHQQNLEAEGYRATENVTVRLNGSVAYTADVAYAASAGGDNRSVDANISVAGKNSSVSIWANESITFVRTVEDGNVSYAAFERGPPEFAGPETDDNETGLNETDQNETDDNETDLNETDDNETGLDDTGANQTDDNQTGLNETDDNETGLEDANQTGLGDDQGSLAVRGLTLQTQDENETNQTDQTGLNETDETEDDETDEMGMDDDGMRMGGMHGMHGMTGDEMQKPGHALLALEGNVGEATIENESEGENFTRRTVTAPLEFEDYRGNATGELTLVVDERGVVHSANVSVTSDLYATDSTYNLSVDELGVEELDQPAWIEEVSENETEGPPQEQPGQDQADDNQTTGEDDGPEPGPEGGPEDGPENESDAPGDGGPDEPGDGGPGDGGPDQPGDGGTNDTAGGGPDAGPGGPNDG